MRTSRATSITILQLSLDGFYYLSVDKTLSHKGKSFLRKEQIFSIQSVPSSDQTWTSYSRSRSIESYRKTLYSGWMWILFSEAPFPIYVRTLVYIMGRKLLTCPSHSVFRRCDFLDHNDEDEKYDELLNYIYLY